MCEICLLLLCLERRNFIDTFSQVIITDADIIINTKLIEVCCRIFDLLVPLPYCKEEKTKTKFYDLDVYINLRDAIFVLSEAYVNVNVKAVFQSFSPNGSAEQRKKERTQNQS